MGEILHAEKYEELVNKSFATKYGKIVKIVGLTIESIGPDANINDLCIITTLGKKHQVYAEVVGFRSNRLLLMPLGNIEGVGVGSMVQCTRESFNVHVGEGLLGKVLDGLGKPIYGEELDYDEMDGTYPVEATPPEPMDRQIIDSVLPLGVKAIDGLITLGKG